MKNMLHCNMDGEILDYEFVSGLSNVSDRKERYNFQNATGPSPSPKKKDDSIYATFANLPSFQKSNFEGDDEEEVHSEILAGTILDKRERSRRRDVRETRKNSKVNAKTTAKTARANAKLGIADAQKQIAKSLNTPPSTGRPTGHGPKPAAKKKGLTMGAKIGIGVGVAVVLGVIGFVVYKKVKKK